MTLGDATIDRFSREEVSKSVSVRFNSYPHFLSKLSVYLPQLKLVLKVVANTTLKTTTLMSSILLTINKPIFIGVLIDQRVMPTTILRRI
jgi:histone deacetylase complex regulatory component SIN3